MSVKAKKINTDALGTFTGEVPRRDTAWNTALRKCELTHQVTGSRLCMGSEGTFGPHPAMPFISAGIEILTLRDFQTGLCVTEQLVTPDNNFASHTCNDLKELEAFAAKIGFPEHALVLRSNVEYAGGRTYKGIRKRRNLSKFFSLCKQASKTGHVRADADMRAHVNPTRMESLRKLAEVMAKRLSSLCPACDSPGWGMTDVVRGLACASCGMPTDLVRYEIWSCSVCLTLERRPMLDALEAAKPDCCPYCNP